MPRNSTLQQFSLLAEGAVDAIKQKARRYRRRHEKVAHPTPDDRPMFDETGTPFLDDPEIERIIIEHTALDEAEKASKIEPDLFGEPTRAPGKAYTFYEFKVKRLKSRGTQTYWISACSEDDAAGTLRVSGKWKKGDHPVWTGRTKQIPDLGDLCMIRDGNYCVVVVREKVLQKKTEDKPEVRAVNAARDKLRKERVARAQEKARRRSWRQAAEAAAREAGQAA